MEKTLIVDREMTGFVVVVASRPDGVSLPSRKRLPDGPRPQFDDQP